MSRSLPDQVADIKASLLDEIVAFLRQHPGESPEELQSAQDALRKLNAGHLGPAGVTLALVEMQAARARLSELSTNKSGGLVLSLHRPFAGTQPRKRRNGLFA